MSATRLRIGYIPLVDAAALIVAADLGFTAAENLVRAALELSAQPRDACGRKLQVIERERGGRGQHVGSS